MRVLSSRWCWFRLVRGSEEALEKTGLGGCAGIRRGWRTLPEIRRGRPSILPRFFRIGRIRRLATWPQAVGKRIRLGLSDESGVKQDVSLRGGDDEFAEFG